MKCVIKKRQDRISPFDAHLADIYGEQGYLKPRYYTNRNNGDEYLYIAGAIAWPTDVPGYVIIVGTMKDVGRTLKIIEGVEGDSVESLMDSALLLRQKYGYGICHELFRTFYGDSQRFDKAVAYWNFLHEKKAQTQNQGVYLSDPVDINSPHAGMVYWRRVKTLLGGHGNPKRLYIGDSVRLRTSIQQLLAEDTKKKKSIDDYPTDIMALGYVSHSMIALAPWLHDIKGEVIKSTRNDEADFVKYAERDQLETDRYLFDDDDGLTGDLRSTID